MNFNILNFFGHITLVEAFQVNECYEPAESHVVPFSGKPEDGNSIFGTWWE